MDVHEARTFRSGGRVALRLPEGLAFAPGERMLIEADGDRLTVSRLPDRRETTRKLRALLPVLEAIGRPRIQIVREVGAAVQRHATGGAADVSGRRA